MEYDDHSYCQQCERHSATCYCFVGSAFQVTDEDEVCRTPDRCVGSEHDRAPTSSPCLDGWASTTPESTAVMAVALIERRQGE